MCLLECTYNSATLSEEFVSGFRFVIPSSDERGNETTCNDAVLFRSDSSYRIAVVFCNAAVCGMKRPIERGRAFYALVFYRIFIELVRGNRRRAGLNDM